MVLASGIAALAYSLLSGGLYHWKSKKGDAKQSQAVQLEAGNFAPNHQPEQSESSGQYDVFSVQQSRYKDWPKEAPTNDGSHYHQNIEVLNQNMAQRYGEV